jgi:hypothetical protein
MKLVQFDFPYAGPFGEDMTAALRGLADSIREEPGLRWKIWTENEAAGEAGGIYLFESAETAEAYVRKHGERLAGFGVTGIRAKVFDVNPALSAITRGPLGAGVPG